MSARLAPSLTPDTRFFWEGLTDHRLLIQRCTTCRALRHPPRPMCPQCNSLTWDTLEASGRGTILSFVMPQHPTYPWFTYPYVVALVELEEGTRLVSNVCEVAPEALTIGLPVEVFYEHFDDGLVLHQFRPAVPR